MRRIAQQSLKSTVNMSRQFSVCPGNTHLVINLGFPWWGSPISFSCATNFGTRLSNLCGATWSSHHRHHENVIETNWLLASVNNYFIKLIYLTVLGVHCTLHKSCQGWFFSDECHTEDYKLFKKQLWYVFFYDLYLCLEPLPSDLKRQVMKTIVYLVKPWNL